MKRNERYIGQLGSRSVLSVCRYVYHTDCNDRIVCDAEYKIQTFTEKLCNIYAWKNGKNLEKSIFGKFDELDEIAELVRANEKEVKEISEKMKTHYQKVGIVKYDAFHEMGGELSFALTMLDENNNGWIFNAMHSREGCYTYIKEVVNGESYIELSSEEKECLEKAVYQEKYDLRDMEE